MALVEGMVFIVHKFQISEMSRCEYMEQKGLDKIMSVGFSTV
jgi:hypothetical protein